MSLGDKFTSGYRGINAFNSGVIKLLVARENDWIEEKLSAILTQSPRIDFEPLIASIVFGRTEGKLHYLKMWNVLFLVAVLKLTTRTMVHP